MSFPTYEPSAPDRYPQYLDQRVYQGSSGKVYPLPMIDRIATEPVDRAWDAIHLENRYVRLMILPELGGRIHVGYDKIADYHFFYRNQVIKPALVGLAGPWIAGGVEFNWPQHHRPATYLPTQADIEWGEDDSVTVRCSDHDPLTRMKGMHGVRLRPESSLIELAARLHNRTSERHTFLWWANVAVRVHDEYQSFFPTDVHWVADHARRAISAFPAADRPYYGVDYPGRDADRLDWFKNIPVPTSYMVTSTAEDFFGGYDHAARAGFVHVADRDIAPGKKQWTWGDAPFGDAWIEHLTDEDGPYIELMAGVYTDNQPDFSFIEPGETKVFSQFWFPYQAIGVVHHATTDAAVHLSVEGGVAHVGIAVTAAHAETTVVLDGPAGELGRWTVDLEPGSPWQVELPSATDFGLRIRIGDLLDWTLRAPVMTPEPAVATEPAAPTEIATADELYQVAVHLEQYRHPTRSPEAYLDELLRRDPGDARGNLARGRRLLAAGRYEDALDAADRAIARLTRYNLNPESGAASMLRGHALVRLGRRSEARTAFAKARWNEAQRHAASFELARLDAAAGHDDPALANAEEALRHDADDLRARALQVILLRRLHRWYDAAVVLADTRRLDPLDGLAAFLDRQPLPDDAGLLLDVASDLGSFGEYDHAMGLFERVMALPPTDAGNRAPMAAYRAARLAATAGLDPEPWLTAARGLDRDLTFPAGLDELDALTGALELDPEDAAAHALLGDLLYDTGRRTEALAEWRAATSLAPDPVTLRNTAVAVVNVEHDDESAFDLYRRALDLAPGDARLWYESDQLLKRMGTSAADRLARIPEHALVRDDLAVEVAGLLVDAGRRDEAVALLRSRPFQPWEGGEGRAIAAWERAAGAEVPPPASLGGGPRRRHDAHRDAGRRHGRLLRNLAARAAAVRPPMILHVDPATPPEPLRGHLPLGDGSLSVTSRYLERDGVPFIPVSAEVHFSRMPEDTWAGELAKIRAAGVTVLATYVIWSHHEQVEGDQRWDGRRDLRRFVTLCVEAGLDVMLRIGPYAHAEVRRGGLPDWLLAKDLLPRSNDPAYLREAERWYRGIAAQVSGLPLFGVQVENELYDDAEHLRTLLRLARECGIHAPIWTATAWGGAQLPVDEVLPLYAGYSEAFWIEWDAGYDAASASNFQYTDERDEVGVGADTRDSSLSPSNLDPSRYPYATCELGGGMVSAYHRRPTASADDIAALALTKLGSGSGWQGYYMFHDGTNPGPGLQESQAAGDRSDLPEFSYDFNAPLGVAGDVRPAYGLLRMQHLALATFGDRIAPMVLTAPEPGPVRWAVRSDGTSGFLFVTNRDSQEVLPDHRDVVFEVGILRFPSVDIPAGAYFFWPVNFDWNRHTIDWATVQLVTATEGALVVVATAGIPPRMSVDGVQHDLPAGGETEVGGLRIRVAEPRGWPARDHRGRPACAHRREKFVGRAGGVPAGAALRRSTARAARAARPGDGADRLVGCGPLPAARTAGRRHPRGRLVGRRRQAARRWSGR